MPQGGFKLAYLCMKYRLIFSNWKYNKIWILYSTSFRQFLHLVGKIMSLYLNPSPKKISFYFLMMQTFPLPPTPPPKHTSLPRSKYPNIFPQLMFLKFLFFWKIIYILFFNNVFSTFLSFPTYYIMSFI